MAKSGGAIKLADKARRHSETAPGQRPGSARRTYEPNHLPARRGSAGVPGGAALIAAFILIELPAAEGQAVIERMSVFAMVYAVITMLRGMSGK